MHMTWSRTLVRFGVAAAMTGAIAMTIGSATQGFNLRDEGRAPDFDGAVGWLNSPPLSRSSLHGRVVLVFFWTYTCINSLRPQPYIKTWAAKYRDAGLVVIGVHTPEFSFEHERGNVDTAVRALNVEYPVAVDSEYRIWRAFHNQYWPALYFIDGKGRIRHHQFGEGAYDEAERVIQNLLNENGAAGSFDGPIRVEGHGIEAPPSDERRQSPETYVGYNRTERFSSPERVGYGGRRTFSSPAHLSVNQWALSGAWDVGAESAVVQAAGGRIVYRFQGRDLNLVLRPGKAGTPVRFKVTLDGLPPGDDHGVDCDAAGVGEIREPRLYQLIRQKRTKQDRLLSIEFLDPGAQAFVFTFG
jgi:thiol-disulfide isomerase/thioredoxin